MSFSIANLSILGCLPFHFKSLAFSFFVTHPFIFNGPHFSFLITWPFRFWSPNLFIFNCPLFYFWSPRFHFWPPSKAITNLVAIRLLWWMLWPLDGYNSFQSPIVYIWWQMNMQWWLNEHLVVLWWSNWVEIIWGSNNESWLHFSIASFPFWVLCFWLHPYNRCMEPWVTWGGWNLGFF